MRLIDLDKVRWTDGFYDMLTGEQFAPMIFNTEEQIEWAIANAEVKAIPIEWIEKWLDKTTGTRDGGDISQLPEQLKFAIGMINLMEMEWEKENEESNNRD